MTDRTLHDMEEAAARRALNIVSVFVRGFYSPHHSVERAAMRALSRRIAEIDPAQFRSDRDG